MKERFVERAIIFIEKYQVCDELKLKKLRYGLEGLYSLIIKLVMVLLLAIGLKTLKETCLILLFYTGLRTFSGGLHAKSNKSCWFLTITIYNVIPLLIKNFNISNIIGYIILGIGMVGMLLWAPADTPKKPFIRKKVRVRNKILVLLVMSVYGIIFLIFNSNIIKNSLIYAVLVQSILINPITYKITKTQFNNYKYYKKS